MVAPRHPLSRQKDDLNTLHQEIGAVQMAPLNDYRFRPKLQDLMCGEFCTVSIANHYSRQSLDLEDIGSYYRCHWNEMFF